MAGAGFKTFVAGDVFTATDANTYLMQQAVMVFTNEAARDAAITSPSEGMVAYLTAPTVPAATGGVTATPTGVKTIYNGTVWVCVTPVGAWTTNTGTTTSGSYTGTLSGSPGTNPSVTLVTGTMALIMHSATMVTSVAAQGAYQSVAVSGAGTVAASDSWWCATDLTNYTSINRCALITGLTAGTNTFTLNYRVGSGNTGTFQYRSLVVQGVS